MITATLTRPTTILPTQSCERKIYLVEQVDVGLLSPPRARTTYREPMTEKSKRRKTATKDKGLTPVESHEPRPSDQDSVRAPENSTEGSVVADEEGPDLPGSGRSPIPSDRRS